MGLVPSRTGSNRVGADRLCVLLRLLAVPQPSPCCLGDQKHAMQSVEWFNLLLVWPLVALGSSSFPELLACHAGPYSRS